MGVTDPNPGLDGPRAKLDWAERHFEAFEKEVERFFQDDANALGVKKKYYPKSQQFLWKVGFVPDIPWEWGLRIGDIVHNLRSSLDHLAWLLVALRSDPHPVNETLVQYPIYETATLFAAKVDDRLPGVSGPIRAVIESRQPYNGRNEVLTLRNLSNDDKHRLLHVALIRQGSRKVEIDPDKIVDFRPRLFTLYSLSEPLKVGTNLYRVRGQVTGPNPQMDVEIEGPAAIALEDGTRLLDVLPEIAL